ncbi:hypothetical protein ADL35_18490, partial [Streptomyces sp. NRRL WC-3753]
READLAAYAHQDLPFEHLVDVLNPVRSLARHPLFQVAFALQNAPDTDFAVPGLGAEVVPVGLTSSKFDLSVVVPVEDLGELGGSPVSDEGSGDRPSIWPHVEERIADLIQSH